MVAFYGKSHSVSATRVRGLPLYSHGDRMIFLHQRDPDVIGGGCRHP